MNKARLIILAVPAMIAASVTSADAHVGIGSAFGFANGALHPIFGTDHILAMIMVGTFAAQLGGRAILLLPSAFVAAMALGGALGMSQVSIGAVELGIALSVFSLGAIVASHIRPALPVAMAIVAFFGIFHGHAHGAEMPESAVGLAYGAGFILTTALLHAAGVGIGLSVRSLNGRYGGAIIRSFGAIVALVGAGLIIAAA